MIEQDEEMSGVAGDEKSAEEFERILAEVDNVIPRSVRMAMLELVMMWARVDTAIAQLATASFAMDPTVGAVIFGKMRVGERIAKMRELNLQLKRSDQAKALKDLKKKYEQHSAARNLIAHATCVGMLRAKPNRLLFLPYEAEGEFGKLAIEIMPVSAIADATRWAVNLDKEVTAMLIDENFWEAEPRQGV